MDTTFTTRFPTKKTANWIREDEEDEKEESQRALGWQSTAIFAGFIVYQSEGMAVGGLSPPISGARMTLEDAQSASVGVSESRSQDEPRSVLGKARLMLALFGINGGLPGGFCISDPKTRIC